MMPSHLCLCGTGRRKHFNGVAIMNGLDVLGAPPVPGGDVEDYYISGYDTERSSRCVRRYDEFKAFVETER